MPRATQPRETQKAIQDYVEKTGIPAMVTPKAKGVISDDHPLFFGTVGGMAGDGLFLELLDKVDLMVGISFKRVDFAKISQGFGANSVRVSSFREFDVALQEAIKAQSPTVIDVPINPDEYRSQIK